MRTLLSRAGRCLAGLLLLTTATATPAVAAPSATHLLTVSLVDRNGRTPDSSEAWIDMFDLGTGEQIPFRGSARLPAGAYQLYAVVVTREPYSFSTLVLPRVELRRDTSLTMDARAARPVEVSLDRPGAAVRGGQVEFLQPTPGRTIRYAAPLPTYLSPTVRAPGLHARVSATFTAGGAERSPYAYTVVRDLRDGVPRHLRFPARVRDLAVRTVTVAGQGRPSCAALETAAARTGTPWLYTQRVVFGRSPFTAGFSPGAEPRWTLTAEVMDADCTATDGNDRFSVNTVFRTAGTGTLAFGRAPLGPALANRHPDSFPYAYWADDTLAVGVPLLADAGPGHYGRPESNQFPPNPYLTGETRLTDAQGQVVYSAPQPGSCSCHVPAGSAAPGPLTLTVDARRTAPWSDLAVRQQVSWTFDADPQRAAVPLLAVRYRAALDGANRAPAGRAFPLGLRVERHDPAGAAVAAVGLEVSYDDGATWTVVPLSGTGDARAGVLRHPARGYVSLRATASDTEGNAVTQTVIRAYALT